jgi:nucleoid DNA-binding protein
VDELINRVTERAGITAEQAKKAVHSVIEYIKENVPVVGEHIKGALEGGGGSLKDLAAKIGDMFGGKKG